MKMRLIDGRDFRETDTRPGSAIVNETFVKQFFPGENPLAKFFAVGQLRSQIVGVVGDAPYRNIRESTLPTVYVPFHTLGEDGAPLPSSGETFLVRTATANPLALASFLRREVSAFQSAFRVSNIRTEDELVQAQTVRERLLAMLALFFAAVALLLAAVGLYGVLDYSVLQRRREIGIRRAIGAQSAGIARLVTADVFSMVFAGAVAGLGLGMALSRYVESLLYHVKPTEWNVLALPAVTILTAALAAAVPSVIRAVQIDPAKMLRSE
jgi:predicted lysophospholipase L1 biosynthesis ABC-type transport system permease subunit